MVQTKLQRCKWFRSSSQLVNAMFNFWMEKRNFLDMSILTLSLCRLIRPSSGVQVQGSTVDQQGKHRDDRLDNMLQLYFFCGPDTAGLSSRVIEIKRSGASEALRGAVMVRTPSEEIDDVMLAGSTPDGTRYFLRNSRETKPWSSCKVWDTYWRSRPTYWNMIWFVIHFERFHSRCRRWVVFWCVDLPGDPHVWHELGYNLRWSLLTVPRVRSALYPNWW